MNNYTDEQLQTAIDASKIATEHMWESRSEEELTRIRLAGARAFLDALTQTEADPYARLKAYNEAGARIRCGNGPWRAKYPWCWACPANIREGCFYVVPADDGPPWIPHDGGPCPLKDEEVEEWEWKLRDGQIVGGPFDPSKRIWSHTYENTSDIIAYRVLKWKPGHGPQAATKADEPAQAEAKPTHEELLAEAMKHPGVADVERIYGGAQLWTPAVGDTVRLKSGGPVMTVAADTGDDAQVMCAWHGGDGCPHSESYLAACLTPAKEGQP